jgi:hypothetical protein
MALLPTQPRKPAQSGSGFTNLNKYLQANQSNRLGNTVSSGVQHAGQGAKTSLTEANAQFQQKASNETARLNQQGQKVGQVLGNVANATDDDAKNFENIRNAQSLGPTEVADSNKLRAQAQEAESLGRAGGSESGRFGLLQRFVGGGKQYNAGNQRLDQMLLGQTGQNQLRQARADTYGLDNNASRQINASREQGKELQGQARQLAESTIGQLGSAATGYDAEMQAKLDNKKAAVNSLLSGIQTGGNSAVELSDSELKQLSDASGGVLGEGTGLYKADLSPFLKMNELYANKQAVQDTTDLDKAKKIGLLSGNSLVGKDAGKTLQEYLGRQDLAGQFEANNKFNVLDPTKLSETLAKAKSDYESETAARNAKISSITNQLNIGSGRGEYNDPNYQNLVNSFKEYIPLKNAREYLNNASNISMNNPDADKNKERIAQAVLDGRVGDTNLTNSQAREYANILSPESNLGELSMSDNMDVRNRSTIDNVKNRIRQFGNSESDNRLRNLVSQIEQKEAEREAAKTELAALPGQFNTLRTLKKRAAPVTS